jgi:hypothetical protein
MLPVFASVCFTLHGFAPLNAHASLNSYVPDIHIPKRCLPNSTRRFIPIQRPRKSVIQSRPSQAARQLDRNNSSNRHLLLVRKMIFNVRKMRRSRNGADAAAIWSRGLPEHIHKSWRVLQCIRVSSHVNREQLEQGEEGTAVRDVVVSGLVGDRSDRRGRAFVVGYMLSYDNIDFTNPFIKWL